MSEVIRFLLETMPGWWLTFAAIAAFYIWGICFILVENYRDAYEVKAILPIIGGGGMLVLAFGAGLVGTEVFQMVWPEISARLPW
jgi:uncharacterized membrane protein YqgA involved in biofilm formation